MRLGILQNSKKKLRAQSAMEMLMLVALSIAFIVPIVMVFFGSTGARSQALSQVQANSVAQQISDASGEVWYQGNGSRKLILVNYPDQLYNISLSGDFILIPGKGAPTVNRTLLQDLKLRGREITVTLDLGERGYNQIVLTSPAPIVNGWALPYQKLDYPRSGAGRGNVRPGLAYILFENWGEYVNATRYESG